MISNNNLTQIKTMNTMNFTITKRDGNTERFSLDKIMNG